MKFSIILLLSLATLGSCSLLEMSQTLWSRVLDGGYQRIGRLDPLRVPVVKVDQSEGDTSYRVILRNLEVTGLNNSRIESVHIERGKLKTNLSDSEAGYVSYNEQRDLDSIRYRFHTLIKEPKMRNQLRSGSGEQFERIVQYDPSLVRAREEDEEFLGFGGADSQQQQQQRYQQHRFEDYQEGRNQQQQQQQQQQEEDTSQYQESRIKQQQQQQQQQQPRKGYQSSYGDMKIVSNTTPRNPDQVRVHYSHNYKTQQQQEQTRPCIGACKRTQVPAGGRVDRISSTEAPTTKGYALNANFGGASFSSETSSQQRRTQFSLKSGSDSGINYSGNYGNGQFSVEGQQQQQQSTGKSEAQNQFSIKSGGESGINFSGNYGNSKVSVEGNSGENADSYGQPTNRFSLKGGIPTTIRSEVGQASSTPGYEVKYGGQSGFQGSYGNGQFSIQSGSAKGVPNSGYYKGATSGRPAAVKGGVRYVCDDEEDDLKAKLVQQQQQQQQFQKRKFPESTTSADIEQFEPYKAPMVRIEKQPGYVDIVYASENSKQSGELRTGPSIDPRIQGYEEIVKELHENNRYIIHNFTEGESLRRRNDAARVAAESQRIKDLLRYAKNHQEQQGYYEEGMEFIYHFGQANGSSANNGTNATLARRKRQHAVDKEEDDVMHVVVRIRVPELSVKSGYALTGKVGKQLLRGNGLLTGNFSDVVADFTVELKRIGNKTLVVRAARAKIVAQDQQVKLQGMDEKGPVEAILGQGLMAAEAVAAMIADDLSTKALSEGDSEDVVFKMYKNLPYIEKE